MHFGLAQSVPRTEDPRLLKGNGRFIDDVVIPFQTHCVFLRSPHAHAEIKNIDISAAVKKSGVIAILTGEDYHADGLGEIIGGSPRKRRDGSPMFRPPRPAITRDRVRFIGQIVAMVIAETAYQASDAAEAILVGYGELPVVMDTANANLPSAPTIWPQCPDNESFFYEIGDKEGVAEAISKAPHIIKQTFNINRVSANSIEPRGAVATYDSGTDHFTIHAGHQRPFAWRTTLTKNLFHIRENQMTLISGDVGGSFGMKGSIYPEIPLVAWASKRVGRPVKWISTRSEGLAADDHGRDNVSHAEFALDDNGKFLALRVQTNANLGAYVSYMGFGAATAHVGGLAGVYTTPLIHVSVAGVFTNTSSISPYRGAGRPEASYIIERLIDLAAKKLKTDPAELRRRNFISKDQLPYKTPLTFTYDCGDFETVMEMCLKSADYDGFENRRSQSENENKLRGIGISCSIEQSAAPQSETAELRFDPSGSLTILAGTTSHGQGHETVYKQLVCEKLGLDPENIRVIEGDTDKVSFGTGTGGSRSATLGTAAVLEGTVKVVNKCSKIAAHLLETDENQLTFEDGIFQVVGTNRNVTFLQAAQAAFQPDKLPPDLEPGLYETATYNPEKANFPNGCHVCELEIDRDTGAIDIIRYTIIYDVGFELNPKLVQGQIQGGVMQSVGQALMEDIVYDKQSGQLLTGSFMDYAMPRASDMCNICSDSHPVLTATNPMGVKGAGECGTVGALPAIMNAINNALIPLNVDPIDGPATREKIWRAINFC